MRWPPRHVAIPAISTELRWMPGGAGRRANRLSLSPRHSASRQSLVPSLPGGSGTGGAGTHIAPFCPLGRGSGALKPARNVPGHEEEGGPEGDAPQPRPQEPAAGSGSHRGRARGSGRCEPLLPCPRSGGSSASSRSSRSGRAPPRLSIGGERSLRAGLGSPAASGGLPLFAGCCRCYPSRLRPVGKELAGTPRSVGFTKI